MNLKINFGSSRVFWGTIAAAGLLVVLILVLWVIPAWSAADEAEADWDAQLTDLKTLQTDAAKIPSTSSLEERRGHREFVEEQAAWVRSFFDDRTKLVYASLTGEGMADPGDFKNAYIRQIDMQRDEFAKTPKVPDPARAYKIYPWVSDPRLLPNPLDYEGILRDYWTRHYLYRIFMGKISGPAVAVAQVNRLEVRERIQIANAPEFEGVPFIATVTIDPRSISRLVNALLAASPTVTDRPVFQLTGLNLVPGADPRTQLCVLTLEGYVLLLKPEKPAAVPAKTGGPGKK